MRHLMAVGVSMLATLTLVGCASNAIRRPKLEAADCPLENPLKGGRIQRTPEVLDRCRERSIEIGHTTPDTPSYTLAVLELDDQGRFRQDEQLTKLFELLKRESDRNDSGGVSVIVFVHGWRHNADVDDSNLEFARTVLYKTVFVEQQIPQYTPNGKPRSVIGVYVGWRGKSLTGPLEVASFWDRKFTAERVATGSVRELFARLKFFRDSQNKKASREHPDCEEKNFERDFGEFLTQEQMCPKIRLLIVGHSFGGLLVYNALSESLIRNVTSADLNGGRNTVVGEYADLVVLVNAAIEGARFEPLYQATLRREYNRRQLPIFVSVTATNDWATRYAFTFGRWFNTIFESESPGNHTAPGEAERIGSEEREANVRAMGHIRRYKTHVLCLRSDTCPPAARSNSKLTELSAEWGQKLPLLSPKSRADCLSALEESLASRYLKPTGIDWDGGSDDQGRPVMFREFLNIDGESFSLTADGLTLRVHDSLAARLGKQDSLLNTPIWMVEATDARIIDGHRGFARQPFRDFLVQLYHDRVMYGRIQDRLLSPRTECVQKPETAGR